MLQVEGLDITYSGKRKVHAVREISFEVVPGQTTTLLGQSGSGKTAITLSILNLLPENASGKGHIFWNTPEGERIDLTGLPENKRREWIGKHIGWVSQGAQRALSPTRTIDSLLREAIKVNGSLQKSEITKEIAMLMAELGLPESILKAYPDQLSGGQKQRCLLALALINRPKILIADEPTTSLDVLNEHLLLKLLQKIQLQRNLGILFITHDLRITSDFQGPCFYMEHGSFVMSGNSANEIASKLQKPINDFSPDKPAERSLGEIPLSADLLSINNLSVTYNAQGSIFKTSSPVKAVQRADFSLTKGESIGIIGASGSGKSSLAKAIAGVLAYEGEIIWHAGEGSQRVQLILQDSYSSLHPRFTVEKTLLEVIRIHSAGLNKPERKSLATSYLKQVQLGEEYLGRFPNQLSGGERQRISIARSLAAMPQLLILDESISSLDFDLQQKMIEFIQSLLSKTGLALIVISHDVRVVRKLCQRMMVMENGKIIESGTTQEVITAPQQQHTRDLITAAGLSHQ